MEYKIYTVYEEEKLSSIAEKFNISPEDIKSLNPNVRFFKVPFGSTYVGYGQQIKVPIPKKIKTEQENNNLLENFTQKARYRCNQNNLVTVDGKPHFSCEIKTQYLLSSLEKDSKKYFKINLEDYITSIEPDGIGEAFELIKQVEFLRKKIIFTQNNLGKISQIYNLKELKKNWDFFSNNEVKNIPFFQELEKRSPDTIKNFIKNGNKEFSNNEEISNILDKNLFYHILLKANLEDELNDYIIEQQSQIYPTVKLKIKVINTKVSEDDLSTTYRLVGTLVKENLDEAILIKYYNEMYKPLIKYSFTEFDYIYRITYVIENKTGLMIHATASISEQIKNNYATVTKYDLKKVEL
ncbi:LysM domain-containing protein [Apibacter muscae]|uniref:LysM peptidoglycan-binding domain-containing protein n=1 Tax=Apibacter muscae TaxID=2509004 RepID=UPI0011ABD496|nr:LysM domain-containing protein [Apibacter muscae]TWP23094.1 LysM domain-containing protein [Apibacter muscae]